MSKWKEDVLSLPRLILVGESRVERDRPEGDAVDDLLVARDDAFAVIRLRVGLLEHVRRHF